MINLDKLINHFSIFFVKHFNNKNIVLLNCLNKKLKKMIILKTIYRSQKYAHNFFVCKKLKIYIYLSKIYFIIKNDKFG